VRNQIERQILIGGCERSGTTLLGAMIGAHSDCVCTPESQFKIDTLRAVGWQQSPLDLVTVLDHIQAHWRFSIWGLDLAPREVPEAELGSSYSHLLAWLVRRYAAHIGKQGATIWVDHTPANIRYACVLLRLFPDARMIHVVRDGRAVAASIMPLDWGPNTVIRAAPWWVEKVAYGLAVESLWPPDRIVRVRYEDLVSNTEAALMTLCEHLGIDYQPSMAEATGFARPTYTSSQHALIGKRPTPRRVSAWKSELSPRQVEVFEYLTHDFLAYLGYELEHGLRTRGPTRLERFTAAICEIVKGNLINTYRARKRRRLAVA
jgi:hypothetical protein